MDDLVEKAKAFAQEKHKNQKRKYTMEPYFKHCEEVANLVRLHGGTPEMIAGAFLHDVIEDCGVSRAEIRAEFGQIVFYYVDALTDVSTPNDGNRAQRKEKDRLHLAEAGPKAKTIKLADLISNSRSIAKYDPGFAKVYMAEKKLLLEILVDGDPDLYAMAKAIVDEYYADCAKKTAVFESLTKECDV